MLFIRNEQYERTKTVREGGGREIMKNIIVGGSNIWDIFYVRVVVVVARVARAVEARAEEVL